MMFGNLVTGCSVLAPRRVGQAVGSAIGGLLYARELMYGIGYAGAAFVALALVMMISTRGVGKAPG